MRVECQHISDEDSGPLATQLADMLAEQQPGDVLTRKHIKLSPQCDPSYTDRLALAQHLALVNSHICNRELLRLCSEGKAAW